MKCHRCGKEIKVNWMVQTHVQTMEGAMAADGTGIKIVSGDPWPEFECECEFGAKPILLSDEDYAKLEESMLSDYDSCFETSIFTDGS